MIVIHRRGGKSTGTLKCILLPRLLEERGLYLHSFPSLTQARGAIWNGMGKITRNPADQAVNYLELIPRHFWRKKNNHEMTLELTNGSLYRLAGIRGTDGTANHLRGLNPLGNVGDEYGEWHGDVISEIFGPIFAQNGGFNVKIGTPKGENHFFTDYIFAKEESEQNHNEKMRSWLLTIEDTYYNDGTPIITQDFIKRELSRGVDPEIIQQEYYCSFKAVASGAWYKIPIARVEREDRIRDVQSMEGYPRYAFWDLGGNDHHTCIIAEAYGDWIRIIDYIEMDSVPIGTIMEEVLGRYHIREHYFPHDGKMRIDMIDHFQSRIEGLRARGIANITRVPRGKVIDGIELAKEVMNICLFDKDKCRILIDHLRNYKKRRNGTTGEFTDTPVHDRHSHGADAFRTMATAWKMGLFEISRGNVMTPRKRKQLSKRSRFNPKYA